MDSVNKSKALGEAENSAARQENIARYISKDGKTMNLPVAIGSTVYTFNLKCSDACSSHKQIVSKLRDESIAAERACPVRCHYTAICHTQLRNVSERQFDLDCLSSILGDWGKRYFADENEALKAGTELVEAHQVVSTLLGLPI